MCIFRQKASFSLAAKQLFQAQKVVRLLIIGVSYDVREVPERITVTCVSL